MATSRILYLIACAALPARRIDTPIRLAQQAGWDVCRILTPTAFRWMQDDPVGGMHLGTLLHLTGRPIRHEFRLPSQENLLPPPNAILVAPLSANTLNKWAAGHADALALGLIAEAIGLPIPIVALPHYNTAQAAHPAIGRSVATLREAGVNVLLGPDGFTPHPPGESTLRTYPWQAAIDALPTPR